MSQNNQRKLDALNNYAYYSNMGIEMGVIIAAGVFGGVKLDQHLHSSPLFTLILSLGSVAIALYIMIKTLLHPKNKKKNESEDTH